MHIRTPAAVSALVGASIVSNVAQATGFTHQPSHVVLPVVP
jgi:hypothetical protein